MNLESMGTFCGDLALVLDCEDLLPISLTVGFFAEVFAVTAGVDFWAELIAVGAVLSVLFTPDACLLPAAVSFCFPSPPLK